MTAASILYAGFGGHEPWLMGLFFLVSSLGFSCITMGVPNYLSGKLAPAEFSSGFGLLQLTQFIGGAFGLQFPENFSAGIDWLEVPCFLYGREKERPTVTVTLFLLV
ncbi:DUF5312 domain-containing protein [Sinobaca sp. H24]|uniref:DUF5312 domain-containing protein n=1 Tax=Sinobaca sp. H24 TaxID=2923376 RepID=UPI00207AF8F3|nr:DUF5312 domain-containing protein [Sinobaca sp. H24]